MLNIICKIVQGLFLNNPDHLAVQIKKILIDIRRRVFYLDHEPSENDLTKRNDYRKYYKCKHAATKIQTTFRMFISRKELLRRKRKFMESRRPLVIWWSELLSKKENETKKSDSGTSIDFNLSNEGFGKRSLLQGGRSFESYIEEKRHEVYSTKKSNTFVSKMPRRET